MYKLSIRVKLLIGFLFLLCSLLLLGILATKATSKINAEVVELDDNWLTGINEVNSIVDDINYFRNTAILRMLYDDQKKLAEFNSKLHEIDADIDEKMSAYIESINQTVYANEADKEADIKLANDLLEEYKQYHAVVDEIGTLGYNGKKKEAMEMSRNRGTQLYEKILKTSAEIIDLNKKGAGESVARAFAVSKNMIRVTVVLLVLAFALGALIAYFIMRDISRSIQELKRTAHALAEGDLSQKVEIKNEDELGDLGQEYNLMIDKVKALIKNIQNNAQQVAASSEELTASADQSAQVTEQIAQSITDVTGSALSQSKEVDVATELIEVVSDKIKEARDTVVVAADKTQQAVDKADNGNNTVNQVISQMEHIKNTVSQSALVVTKLGERSKEIGNIVDTISGIAGQTNLLALNAAIEAARAGEQGKGFAVVAEEVRKLAEQVQEAVKQISELIYETQNDTEEAVVAMNNGTEEVQKGTEIVNLAGAAFSEILEMVKTVNSQAVAMADIMTELNQNTDRIVQSVIDIDNAAKAVSSEAENVSAAAEEQAASVEQIATSSSGLANLANDLQAAANKFKM